jgi:hypothetical protein
MCGALPTLATTYRWPRSVHRLRPSTRCGSRSPRAAFAKLGDESGRWPDPSGAKIGLGPVKRLVELFALVLIEIVRDRALTEALQQPLNEIDSLGLGLGQAEQLGHQLRRNRHCVFLPRSCVARLMEGLERDTGFEPATFSLGS